MASPTVNPTTTTADNDSDPPLQLDSIQTVDLRLLSQSDLYSLSLCSDSAFDPRRCDDVVIPKIDRSVFNESAGSRKQTYSRLRLAPASSFSNSAVSSSSSLHRRTPHLCLNNLLLNTQNNPEGYENSQIVLLLNQLFAANEASGSNNSNNVDYNNNKINNIDLVPIRVDYTETLPQSAYVVDTVTLKRKRGRPRKYETTAAISVVPQLGRSSVIRHDVIKDIFVCENVDEREKEILNRDGVAVDLVALSCLQDPYEEELKRKTQGLVREEEIKGFLNGLSGQWGSKTMKKKIVDASEFGDTLPMGWRLQLSVKKREARAWLSCRRYISPNGRQFVSCKDISSYLLSIIGLHDAKQMDYDHSDKKIFAEDNITSGNVVLQAANITFQNCSKMENLSYQSSSPLSSLSEYHENQETLKSGDQPEVQVGQPFQCQKCPMTFEEKDEFLNHQLSFHWRKRSKIGTSITEGVIIKEGKYECQFCCKTFEEINHYNGHVGAHVKNNLKSADELPAVHLAKSIDAPSFDEFTLMESMAHASTLAESNVAEMCNPTSSNIKAHSGNSGNEFNILVYNKHESLDESKGKSLAEEATDVLGRECVTSNNEMERVYESRNAVKSNVCSVPDAALFNNENSKNEVPFEATCIECSENVGKRSSFESGLPSPVPSGQTCVAKINDIGVCDGQEFETSAIECSENVGQRSSFECGLPSPFPHEQVCVADNPPIAGSDVHEADSESCLISSMGNKEESAVENMEVEQFADNKQIFGFCDDQGTCNDDSVAQLKQCSHPENCSLDPSFKMQNITNADETNGALTSVMAESEQKKGPVGTSGVDDNRNKVSSISFDEPELDGTYNPRSIVCENYAGSDKIVISLQEDKHVKRSSIVPSKSEEEQVNEHYKIEVSPCNVELSWQKEGFERSSLAQSGYQQNCVKDYVDRGQMGKIEEFKIPEVQDFFNREFVPSDDTYNGQSEDIVNSPRQKLCLEVCTPGTSGKEQAFGIQDYATGVYPSTVERKQERSEIDLFTQFCFAETSDNVYVSNKMYAPTANEPKHDELQNFGNQELSLAFGNFHEGLNRDIDVAQQESYAASCSTIPSVTEQPFSIQTNLGSANGGRMEDLRQKSGLLNGLHISPCSSEIHGFEESINPIYGSRVWDRPQVDEVRNSGNQFMISFGSTHVQPHEDVMAGEIWKTGEDNFLLQNDFACPSSQLVESSSSFHTFDIISDKGEGTRLKVNAEIERDSGFQGLRSIRTEPVEFSFPSMQNSNSFTGDSKVFSYTGMEQGYNSSFLLGKEALMSNISVRNPRAICVWCKNEFRHDSTHSGAQTGSNGSLCPTCSGRFSGRFNVL